MNGGYARNPHLFLQYLTVGIGRIFDCESKIIREADGKFRLHVYGYKSDVEITKHLFQFLINQLLEVMNREFDRINPSTGRRKWRTDFLEGAVLGVLENVRKVYVKKEIVTSSGTSLMVLKKDAIVAKFGEFNYRKIDDDWNNVTALGFRKGEEIKINKVIKSDSTTLQGIEA